MQASWNHKLKGLVPFAVELIVLNIFGEINVLHFYLFPVRNSKKSHVLIGCCPVQFFTIRTAHVSITILSRFCSQIKLKTSYNWEHLVEVSKMNAYFHVQLVTEWFLFLYNSSYFCSTSPYYCIVFISCQCTNQCNEIVICMLFFFLFFFLQYTIRISSRIIPFLLLVCLDRPGEGSL